MNIKYEDFNKKDWDTTEDGIEYNMEDYYYDQLLCDLKYYVNNKRITDLSRINAILVSLVKEFKEQEEISVSLDKKVKEFITNLVEQKNKELNNKGEEND